MILYQCAMVSELLPAHALSGCDTVPMCHGIGKSKMLKAVKAKKYSLGLLGGEVNADMEDVINQAMAFMCKCYSMSNTASMTEARIKVWTARIGRKAASKIPKLYSLPPTTEAFQLNVRRAHFQCAIWSKKIISAHQAPDYIPKLVCCSCSSVQPCHSSRCGCVATSPRLHTETCMLLVFICTTMSFK